MSEYQYYEFQAIERPLVERELRELRALSSRAEVTPTSFTNVYNYGDFRGKPSTLVEKYFDGFLYVANWGVRELMLRLPKSVLPPATATQYCVGESAAARSKGNHVILTFRSEEEGGDWEEGEGLLSAILPVRAEIARGDLRGLYLGWMLSAQSEEIGEDDVEPDPPPGLGKLTGAQKAFADFLRLDEDLIAAAAAGAPPSAAPASTRGLAAWIKSLSAREKDALLLRAAKDGAQQLQAELLRRFQASRPRPAKERQGKRRCRTVGELLAAAEDRRGRRRRPRTGRSRGR